MIHEKFHQKFFEKTTKNYLVLTPEDLKYETGNYFEKKFAGGVINYNNITENESEELLKTEN